MTNDVEKNQEINSEGEGIICIAFQLKDDLGWQVLAKQSNNDDNVDASSNKNDANATEDSTCKNRKC